MHALAEGSQRSLDTSQADLNVNSSSAGEEDNGKKPVKNAADVKRRKDRARQRGDILLIMAEMASQLSQSKPDLSSWVYKHPKHSLAQWHVFEVHDTHAPSCTALSSAGRHCVCRSPHPSYQRLLKELIWLERHLISLSALAFDCPVKAMLSMPCWRCRSCPGPAAAH